MSNSLKIPGSRIMAVALLLAILTIIVPAAPASAVPPAPHQFYGNVFVGGVAPTTGTIIAKINGVQYATGSIDMGRYGYSTPLFRVPADNPDTTVIDGGVPGDTVQFFVGGTQAYQTCAFLSGSSTNLDLTVPGSITPPAVTTVAAGNIASTTVTLNGNLTATGSQVPLNVYFRYGTTMGYGMATAPVSTSSTGQFAAYVSGLTPGTTYNFIAVAEGSSNVIGTNLTFATLASSVTVSTVAATNVGTNAATLNGNLTSLGGTGGVEVYFQYGTNGTTWPYTTPRQGMSAIGTFSYPINALSSNTKYYFQAVAVFGGNSVTGSILNFTTLPQGGSTAVNRFYGTVYVGGSPSSATVVAYLNGVATTPASTTFSTTLGQYGYSPLFNVYGGPGTVTFKVNNVLVPQTATWTSGGVTQLDLYASGSPTPTGVYVTNGIGATNVTTSTATLNGELVSTGGANPSVSIYWGTADRGQTKTGWDKTTIGLGTRSAGTFSSGVTGLSNGTTYFYRCYAENTTGSYSWANPATSFTAGVNALTITSTSPITGGTANSVYTYTFGASGGSGVYTWSLLDRGTLPTTLSLSTTGLLTGTPTVAGGPYDFTVQVTDSLSASISKAFQLTVTSGSTGSEIVGSTGASPSINVNGNAIWLYRCQATGSNTITSMNVKASWPGHVKVAIYDDSDGSVGDLIIANNTSTVVTNTSSTPNVPKVNPVPLSTAIISGDYYWLAFVSDTSTVGGTSMSGTVLYQTISTSYADFTFPASITGYASSYNGKLLIAGAY